MNNLPGDIGVVVIGRNEGERLHRCLASVAGQTDRIVYVDSGSVDGSIEFAQTQGVAVVRLDLRTPFSAGRARNEGFILLTTKYPDLQFIQFIDGDCELCPGWLSAARASLLSQPSCAIVAGRRKERYPQQSIYNLLCDMEWDTPIGTAQQCGGDFMIRASTFADAGGFNPEIVAGEEPEMCYRLRKKNWSVMRLDHAMTLHDAAIGHFSQWWRRYIRTGHAYAQGYALHARDGQGYCLRESAKSWLWACILPVAILTLTLTVHPAFLLLATLYLVQFGKIALHANKRLGHVRHALIYALFTVIGKFPQFIGQLLFFKRKLGGGKYFLIEYKSA